MSSPSPTCAKCGADLAGSRLGQFCPRCLAALALGPTPEPPDPPKGITLPELPGYALIEEVGRGGMGVVFKARQLRLNRIVAVKTILTGQLASPLEVQRLRAEAEAAARLQHPNIVAIHEIGEQNGLPYFSMDFIDGKSLAEMAGPSPLEPDRAARYVRIIAEAIEYAHQHGILHRDLKPSNVLIDRSDQPRVTDFGLAKRLIDTQSSGGNYSLTLTGQVLGTPNFIPPEQAGANQGITGPPSDVYSLGAILYFLLTARPPFFGNSIQETLARVLNSDPVALRKLNPRVPRDLETICLKCLDKDPLRRYLTAQALADDLGAFLGGEPIHARPIGRIQRSWRWCRRHPATAGLWAGLVLSLSALVVTMTLMATRKGASTAPDQASRTVASRPSHRYDGPLYDILALDGVTFAPKQISLGGAAAVDLLTGNYWAANLDGGVIVRSGKTDRILTNINLGDCPGSVTIDASNRVVWVTAQCGTRFDTNFANSDLLWAIHADTYALINSIVSGGINGETEVVNPATGKFYHGVDFACQCIERRNFRASMTSFGMVLAANPDAGLLYARGAGTTLEIVDARSDAERILTNVFLPFDAADAHTALSPALNRLYVTSSTTNCIAVLDPLTGSIASTFVLDNGVKGIAGIYSMAVDEKRRRLFAIAHTGPNDHRYLFVIDGSRQHSVLLPDVPGGFQGFVFNPVVNKLYFWGKQQTNSAMAPR